MLQFLYYSHVYFNSFKSADSKQIQVPVYCSNNYIHYLREIFHLLEVTVNNFDKYTSTKLSDSSLQDG